MMRAAVAWLLLLLPWGALAQPREHEVKAAFLFKFLSFVEWPAAALPAGAPIVMGVVGGEDVAAELQSLASGRTVEGRRVSVRRLSEGEAPADVHLVFFGRGEAARLRELQRRAPTQPLLVVCEWESALDSGAVVNFLRGDGRVRFEVALDAAERRGLRISPRMLAVAQLVRPSRP
jgi:hypothetical protein